MEAAAERNTGTLIQPLVEYSRPDSYPIAAYTYMIVHMVTMKDCDSASELLRYVGEMK